MLADAHVHTYAQWHKVRWIVCERPLLLLSSQSTFYRQIPRSIQRERCIHGEKRCVFMCACRLSSASLYSATVTGSLSTWVFCLAASVCVCVCDMPMSVYLLVWACVCFACWHSKLISEKKRRRVARRIWSKHHAICGFTQASRTVLWIQSYLITLLSIHFKINKNVVCWGRDLSRMCVG